MASQNLRAPLRTKPSYKMDYVMEKPSIAQNVPGDVILLIKKHVNYDTKLKMTHVCRSWRDTIVTTSSCWRDLALDYDDKDPIHKISVVISRAGPSGLKFIDINDSCDRDRATNRSKAHLASGSQDQSSRFQEALHAIEMCTPTGVVHELGLFKYSASQELYEADMAYMIRFLLRPYIQPIKIMIECSEQGNKVLWNWYKVIPMMPLFNRCLREFSVKCTANVCYNFTKPETENEKNNVLAWLVKLKVVQIGIKRPPSTGTNDYESLLHGIYRAADLREDFSMFEGGEDIVHERVRPGQIQLALAHVGALMDGWSTHTRMTPKYIKAGDYKPKLRVRLPNLHTLVLGLDRFTLLEYLTLPALEKLLVGTPKWNNPNNAELTRIIESRFVRNLHRIGGKLAVFDIGQTFFGKGPLMDELNTCCPNLKVFCCKGNNVITYSMLKEFILEKREILAPQIAKLKKLNINSSLFSHEEMHWLEERVGLLTSKPEYVRDDPVLYQDKIDVGKCSKYRLPSLDGDYFQQG